MNQINSAIEDIGIIKRVLLDTRISFSEVASFLMWYSGYYVIIFLINILQIYTVHLLNENYSNIWSILSFIPFAIFVVLFIYYKKKIKTNYFYSLCLIDLWGYAFIVNIIFNNILSKIYFIKYDSLKLQQISTFWISAFVIALCIFVTGLLLKDNFIKLVSSLYLFINLFYFFLPNLTLSIKQEHLITFSTTSIFSNLLNAVTIIIIYLYLKKKKEVITI